MAEQAIEVSQRGLHRSVWTAADTGDTISNYRHGVIKTIKTGASTSGTITISDTAGTVFAIWTPAAESVFDLNIPFEGVLTVTVGGTLTFTLVIEA